MHTLEVFAVVFGVSAWCLGWAFDLWGGHFWSLGWSFSGASYLGFLRLQVKTFHITEHIHVPRTCYHHFKKYYTRKSDQNLTYHTPRSSILPLTLLWLYLQNLTKFSDSSFRLFQKQTAVLCRLQLGPGFLELQRFHRERENIWQRISSFGCYFPNIENLI